MLRAMATVLVQLKGFLRETGLATVLETFVWCFVMRRGGYACLLHRDKFRNNGLISLVVGMSRVYNLSVWPGYY